MGTTNTLDLNNRVTSLEKAVSGGDSAQANKTDIATEFNATTNYTAGCFVYYGGKLYQFNADHSAGAWDPTDAVEANVTDQVVSNAAAIAGLTASDVAYDNTGSGLTATDVQSAIDEVATNRYKYKVRTISDRTVNSGYLDIIDSDIKLTSVVFVQLCRSSGIWEKYAAYPIINYEGYVTIYFRDTSNGQRPPDNSTVTFNLLIINT